VGFTVLTSRTALFGNSTGIRRALDRIKEGTAKRELPGWATKIVSQNQAPLAFGSKPSRAGPNGARVPRQPDAAR
jgi:hypothetical protein